MTITGNAVARRDGQDVTAQATTALAIRPGQEMWSDKQKAALAVLGIKEATNADLAVFMHYCQKTGLDPFSRQIYMIMRREKQGDQWVAKQTIQVGIDGFRVIRDRVAQRLGVSVEYEDTIWYDAEGTAYNVWLWDHAPTACMVTVVKDGRRFPGVVRTAAYAARNKQGEMVSQWKTQPDHMIEKCAEAFALRRAFPHDLGGIYIDEETPGTEVPAAAAPARLTAADIGAGRRAPRSAATATVEPAAAPPPADRAPEAPADAPDLAAAAMPDAGAAEGSSTQEQYAALWGLFTERFGFTRDDKAQARQACEQVIGRQLTGGTMGNLSGDEADRLIAGLGKLAGRDDLIALLAQAASEPPS